MARVAEHKPEFHDNDAPWSSGRHHQGEALPENFALAGKDPGTLVVAHRLGPPP